MPNGVSGLRATASNRRSYRSIAAAYQDVVKTGRRRAGAA
jgi:hypothetical protein